MQKTEKYKFPALGYSDFDGLRSPNPTFVQEILCIVKYQKIYV